MTLDCLTTGCVTTVVPGGKWATGEGPLSHFSLLKRYRSTNTNDSALSAQNGTIQCCLGHWAEDIHASGHPGQGSAPLSVGEMTGDKYTKMAVGLFRNDISCSNNKSGRIVP